MLKENRGEKSEKESMQTAIPLVMFGNISFECVCVLKVDKIYLQISRHRSYLTKLILSASYSFSSSRVMQKTDVSYFSGIDQQHDALSIRAP